MTLKDLEIVAADLGAKMEKVTTPWGRKTVRLCAPKGTRWKYAGLGCECIRFFLESGEIPRYEQDPISRWIGHGLVRENTPSYLS